MNRSQNANIARKRREFDIPFERAFNTLSNGILMDSILISIDPQMSFIGSLPIFGLLRLSSLHGSSKIVNFLNQIHSFAPGSLILSGESNKNKKYTGCKKLRHGFGRLAHSYKILLLKQNCIFVRNIYSVILMNKLFEITTIFYMLVLWPAWAKRVCQKISGNRFKF